MNMSGTAFCTIFIRACRNDIGGGSLDNLSITYEKDEEASVFSSMECKTLMDVTAFLVSRTYEYLGDSHEKKKQWPLIRKDKCIFHFCCAIKNIYKQEHNSNACIIW